MGFVQENIHQNRLLFECFKQKLMTKVFKIVEKSHFWAILVIFAQTRFFLKKIQLSHTIPNGPLIPS